MLSLQRILAQAIRDPGSFATLRAVLANDLATPNPFYRQIVQFVSSFWETYKQLPLPGDYEVWVSTLPDSTQVGVAEVLSEVLSLPIEEWTPDYVSTEVCKALKETATRTAIARLGSMMPNPPPGALEQLTEEIKKVEPITLNGIKDLKDVRRWIYHHKEVEREVPTGITTLDNLIGGFRNELVFVVADSGVGKSTFLLNFGKSAALVGSRVLHITYEVSAENTLKRYYRTIAESTGGDIRGQPEVVIDKVTHWLRFARGSVHVMYRPPFDVGASELEMLIDQFTLLYGKPDVVILDYLDLMKPDRTVKDTYEGLGILSHKVRNIGVQRDCSMISATQATRSAHIARHLRLDMMGDSYNKVRAADIILGLVQTQEEYEANQGRLGVLKMRENPGRGIEIPIYINMDYMLISDLDHPNTQRIITQLHHNPISVFTENGHQLKGQ